MTINTGLPAGNVGLNKEWAPGFIYGLVPPDDFDASKACPSGISKVETQQSFLNGLVSVLTLGIFTPWTVTVTCAGKTGQLPAGAHVVTIPHGASGAEIATALNAAVDESKRDGAPVYVKF
jgi:hypothetical protein